MTSVEKLKEDLDYWIMIGIGDDIVSSPSQRPEYQHLVKFFKDAGARDEHIPDFVLIRLTDECDRFVLLRPTFWRLLWLRIKQCV